MSWLKFALQMFLIKTMNNLVKFKTLFYQKSYVLGFHKIVINVQKDLTPEVSPENWGREEQRIFKNKNFQPILRVLFSLKT